MKKKETTGSNMIMWIDTKSVFNRLGIGPIRKWLIKYLIQDYYFHFTINVEGHYVSELCLNGEIIFTNKKEGKKQKLKKEQD